MRRPTRCALFALTIGVATNTTVAQEPRFLYPAPAPGVVTVRRDVPIGARGLLMDVYRPSSGGRAPALIFFSTGARATAFYASWAQTAASKGIVGIVPDLRPDSGRGDFQALVAHVTAHAADYGIDPEALAVYAGSGNVSTAFPIVEDPTSTAIKAAVMYYGGANIQQFRRDLPLLYVRAGLDRPDVNTTIITLASRALSQNAPVTVLNHPTGHHAFEIVDDDSSTRDVIDRTLEFIKRATAPAYQIALRAGQREATAAAHVATGNFAGASMIYRELVAAKPDDSRMRLSFGEALLGDAKYREACAQFEQLKGKGLGPRDLGLPAARACARNGDLDAALAWLKSIPSRFLPRSVENDSSFASLRSRADFRALFQPPG